MLSLELPHESGRLDLGLFDFFKPKDASRQRLLDLLIHNADIIQRNEGNNRSDAEYLAACMIIDDLQKRPDGRPGCLSMMDILRNDYPQHLGDVITYLAWSSGQLHLKPEAEAELAPTRQ